MKEKTSYRNDKMNRGRKKSMFKWKNKEMKQSNSAEMRELIHFTTTHNMGKRIVFSSIVKMKWYAMQILQYSL